MTRSQAPPPSTAVATRGTKYSREAADCKARPHEWAVIEYSGPTLAGNIRAGMLSDFRPVGHWEATRRRRKDGPGFDTYVRFTGGALKMEDDK